MQCIESEIISVVLAGRTFVRVLGESAQRDEFFIDGDAGDAPRISPRNEVGDTGTRFRGKRCRLRKSANVRFNSMQNRLLFMSASEMIYDRR